MPSGYTAILQEQPELSFREFALRCSRAMGACIMQRDDSLSSSVVFDEVGEYYVRRVEAAKQAVYDRDRMSVADAKEAQAKEIAEFRQRANESSAEKQGWASAYGRMLNFVEAWEPPTGNHEGLKKFMREQLSESTQWDCGGGGYYSDALTRMESLSPAEWLADNRESAAQELERAKQSLAEDVERTNGRNEWKRQLLASLEATP